MPFPLLFPIPAIYNYNASQEVELSLQIGDSVHILEMYEGESGWLPARQGERQGQWKLLINKALRANFNTLHFLEGWKSRKSSGYMISYWGRFQNSQLNTGVRTRPVTRIQVCESKYVNMLGSTTGRRRTWHSAGLGETCGTWWRLPGGTAD